jgi:hypothetical protein
VEVVNELGHGENVAWQLGTMVYLKGTVGLRCSSVDSRGGSVICIMLALNHEEG